jgi:DNA-binding NtrC family response regulator
MSASRADMTTPLRPLLLVEHEQPLRENLAQQFTALGFEVVQADDGASALARMAEFVFDVLIIDVHLADMSGAQVMAMARDRYPDIISIVVTGSSTVKDAVAAVERGAADFVVKPFAFDELAHAVRSAIEIHRLRQENANLRAQLEAGQEVQEAAVPLGSEPSFPDTGIDLDRVLSRVEQDLIRRSLAKTSGNKLQAARLLNLKRTTLVEKIKRMNRDS